MPGTFVAEAQPNLPPVPTPFSDKYFTGVTFDAVPNREIVYIAPYPHSRQRRSGRRDPSTRVMRPSRSAGRTSPTNPNGPTGRCLLKAASQIADKLHPSWWGLFFGMLRGPIHMRSEIIVTWLSCYSSLMRVTTNDLWPLKPETLIPRTRRRGAAQRPQSERLYLRSMYQAKHGRNWPRYA
jgi:hypothetical protein